MRKNQEENKLLIAQVASAVDPKTDYGKANVGGEVAQVTWIMQATS
jgi:hypothetical protein